MNVRNILRKLAPKNWWPKRIKKRKITSELISIEDNPGRDDKWDTAYGIIERVNEPITAEELLGKEIHDKLTAEGIFRTRDS